MFFGATSPSSPYGFDEPWTPLASPSKSRLLAAQDQSGVGFAARWRLAFSAVFRADFTIWASPSPSFAEC